MSDAIKFKNNKYLDTSGSVHNGTILKTWLENLLTTVNGKSNNGHTHDDRYYTESEINTKLNAKQDKISDSGWVNVPLNTALVAQYGSNNPALRCRKFGPVITVAGILKSNYAFTPTDDTSHRLATLPSGYRPSYDHNVIMQGSGSNRWMCAIRPDGNMYISRYSNNTTANNQVPSNAWLNILVTFMEG